MDHDWVELSIFGVPVMVCSKCGDVQGRRDGPCPGVDEVSESWKLVRELLILNPQASYARIGREVGYTGQSVGLIAKLYGMPPRKAGGFHKKDERRLKHPLKRAKTDGS